MNEAYMEKLFSLDGKTAVVTGSSSGIGQAIAEALANFGAHVAVMGRSQQGIEETCTRIRSSGGSCQGYVIDITDEEAQNRFFDDFLAEHKHLDIFVANAGINVRGELPEVTAKEMELLLGTDFLGTIHGLNRAADAMKKQHSGNMVIITSVNALSPLANQALYSAIKSAMESVMRSLAVTMAEYGVRVNSCAPGCIHSALNQHIFSQEQFRREKERGIPLGRIGNPEDIGDVVACMVSDAYRFMTGSTILVDGGELLRPKMKQPAVDCAKI